MSKVNNFKNVLVHANKILLNLCNKLLNNSLKFFIDWQICRRKIIDYRIFSNNYNKSNSK